MRGFWNTVLKGLVAILPLGLTIYIVYWLAAAAESVFSGVLAHLIPAERYWPGLGLLGALLVLYLVGLAVNAFLVRRMLRFSDAVFSHIPGVKTVYMAIRDFTRFFPSSGQSSDLKRVVLIPFGPGQAIGFVTAESGAALGVGSESDDLVAVYLPMSYMIGGYTVFLPRSSLVSTSLSVEAGMRIALMGGVQGGAGPIPAASTARRGS